MAKILGAHIKGPQTVIANWTPVGSWVTNTTYTGKLNRDGEYLEGEVRVALSGAPNSTNLTINLPAGLTIDTAKLTGINPQQVGIGTALQTGIDAFSLWVLYNSTTSIIIQAMTASGTYTSAGTSVNQSIPFTFANTHAVIVKFRVPIVGWSANDILRISDDTKI